jgi:PAS domain S-box-containing protein
MDRYKHFFYNNLDLACFANLEGCFEELNENFTKVLGYTGDELLGKPFAGFIHPEDLASTQEMLKALEEGHDAVSFVNRFRMKSNEYKFLEWSLSMDPETGMIYAIARDITDKIVAQEKHIIECNEKEARAAELIIVNEELAYENKRKEKHAADLIIANVELAFRNREKEMRAAELIVANEELNFQNEEKEKRAAELIVANEELNFQNEEKEKRAAELAVANKELSFQNKEKEKRSVELSASNSALKKTKDFLQHYIRGLEEMMFMTSHSVRQPIANILGVVNLFDKSLDSPGEMTKLLGFIKKSAHDLEAFTRDLMSYMSKLVKKKEKSDTWQDPKA